MIQSQQHRLTLYGAIGSCLSEPVYMIGTATDAEQFCDFLRMLINRLSSDGQAHVQPILVLDNHCAHHAKSAVPLLDHFTVLWLPPYSSQLNSIERLWAVIKTHFRKHRGIKVASGPLDWHKLAELVL